MIITDMETWLHDYDDRIIRYQVYRKMFTPYEMEMKFTDESPFEDGYYQTLGKIEEAIHLGGSEWLLGIRTYFDDTEDYSGGIEYHKLSDIKLCYWEEDGKGEKYE